MTSDMLTVALGERTYDIFFGEDVYPLLQEWICRFFPGRSVFVVTDRTVAAIYGDDIRAGLGGISHRIHAVEPGEETKNWQTVLGIYAFLSEGNADRDSLVIAFGGGVVGDLAGFAAATWLRGVPYIQVPTTLLSQVDSSVGGKTGFNLPEGKNLVGAFHQPRAVFIGDGFLRTLDDRQLLSGMGEVVKCALAGDAALWETLCSIGSRWRSMSGREWRDVVRRTVAFKASIVEKDELESSVRRVLNLGHTVGHAMEQAGGYGNLLHGEAVAMGLAWEAVLARRLGVTPREVEERLCSLLKEFGFALDEPGIASEAIASAIGADKKRVVSDVDLPMVTAPGAFVLKRIPLSLIRKELPAVREEVRRRDRGTSVDSAEEKALRARMEGGDLEGAIRSLERLVAENPRDLRAMSLLSEAYLAAGKYSAAWETIKEALHQYPADPGAQRLAREIERELIGSVSTEGDAAPPPLEDVILLDEGIFEIRPAELPEESAEESAEEPAPSVLTVTMADVCWDQGEREIARRIIDEILRRDPGDIRALEWKKTREERAVETALAFFLGTIAKEYGYELSGPH
ncbi:MAG: 3-dehydroquinate synthase [Deltaproteobacteria bacterium]|nr:3-dehydroquinate synthase [Deltaproteobacteria bacterium]